MPDPQDLTDAEMAELERLCEAAMVEFVVVEYDEGRRVCLMHPDETDDDDIPFVDFHNRGDFELFAVAGTALPRLLSELRRLRAERKEE